MKRPLMSLFRQMMEKTIEVMKHIPPERVQNNTVEQIVDVPVSQIHEETVEVPQVQHIGKIGDVSVVTQRSVPTIQTAQKA